MGNIHTYLQWRGDLDFQERPLCEIDHLALSLLSYLDLNGIVPEDDEEVTLKDAFTLYQDRTHPADDEAYRGFFREMAESRRFASLGLSRLKTVADEETATQFFAILIDLKCGRRYVSFRGTDYSITGWQEDFEMGSEVVPSQREAVNYLNEVLQPDQPCSIGGHSKGGNLALYSAVYCKDELRGSIIDVYNFDGPGLSRDIVPTQSLACIDTRLHWIVPEYSVIGTLFPYKGPTKIVTSTARGLLQHDALTWGITGDAFDTSDALDEDCQILVDILDSWISSADLEQRKVFTHDLFEALRAGGATTVDEILGDGIDGFGTILFSIANAQPPAKVVMRKLLHAALEKCRSIRFFDLMHSKSAVSGALLMLSGVLLMAFPAKALSLIEFAVGAMGILYLGNRTITVAVNPDMAAPQKRSRVLTCLICIVTVEFLIVNQDAVTMIAHLIPGILLLVIAFRTFCHAAGSAHRTAVRILMCALAVLAMCMAMISFTKDGEGTGYIIAAGAFFAAYGIALFVHAAYVSGERHAHEHAS